MSRAAYADRRRSAGARAWATAKMIDMMVGALTDPFDTIHMGVTAENVAAKCELTRERAGRVRRREPQARAPRRTAAGHFKSQILPIELKSKKGPVHVRHRRARPRRRDGRGHGQAEGGVPKENGTVTAGNASGINDAAAAVVLMEKSAAAKKGLKPMARLVAYGHAGHRSQDHGPRARSRRSSARSPRRGSRSATWTSSSRTKRSPRRRSASPRSSASIRRRSIPNGGAVALGHPIGATGCILTIKAMYELQRTGGRYGLITMCIGGGQGIAAIIERMD